MGTRQASLAETAFRAVARAWEQEAQLVAPDAQLPRSLDLQAFACVLGAAEAGREFTAVAWARAERSRVLAERRPISWLETLPWKLCQELMEPAPAGVAARDLVINLDHPQSSVRYWLFEIAWLARARVAPDEAVPRLLKNVADTLAWSHESAGLAAALMASEDEFWETARVFKAPSPFEDQYDERLAAIEGRGLTVMQAPFWKLETEARKLLFAAALEAPLDREGASQGQEGPAPYSITREEARRIAEESVKGDTLYFPEAAGIGAVVDLQEIRKAGDRGPALYDSLLEGAWIAYVRRKRPAIRSSDIIVISKSTGEIIYRGSANDEG